MVGKRKQRPRSHIIAALSVNFVEKIALLNDFAVDVIKNDYGYDLNIYTYNSSGEIENGFLLFQLKASDSVRYINNNQDVSFTLDKRDLDLWLNDFLPVVLVIYDAVKDVAYYLYVQAYFQNITGFSLEEISDTHTVNIPVSNILTKEVMSQIANAKNRIFEELPPINHGL